MEYCMIISCHGVFGMSMERRPYLYTCTQDGHGGSFQGSVPHARQSCVEGLASGPRALRVLRASYAAMTVVDVP